MSVAINKHALRDFIEYWSINGVEEKKKTHSFWTELFQNVFSQTGVTRRLDFEKDVINYDGNTSWADVYIPETHVLVEQKSLGIELDKPQPGHNNMTPYEQAKMYDNGFPRSEKSRWIVLCNFSEFWIYDMEKSKPEKDVIKVSLANLEKDYHLLTFLFDESVEKIQQEFEISDKASKLIGEIYDTLHSQYSNPTDDDLKSLNLFCVRLVFCYYAEDAELFNKYQFKDYVKDFPAKHLRTALKELFCILDTEETMRDPNEEEELLGFPYVNGGLFSDRNVSIPQIDEKTKALIVAASDFNWSEISPTIFGALFESTLNEETRHTNGMHYTSIENIHKVIDPLFLDDLKSEYNKIHNSLKNKRKNLKDFQDKLSSLKFIDPACGSGNFLTETYLSLRRIENEVIKDIAELDKKNNPNQIALGDIGNGESIVKINPSQFYGFEINDFAVAVSKTALWIAESQMLKETQNIVYHNIEFLPLKSNVHIIECNALRTDWKTILKPEECSYIMGNPPFLGSSKKEAADEQKEDRKIVFGSAKAGKLDYVACWYKKAADYIDGTAIKCAFVSTNSISQGEQVRLLWEPLRQRGFDINFAYRTFRWDSEANIKAHVFCIIIGFSKIKDKNMFICDKNIKIPASHINGYLIDYADFFIESRGQPHEGMSKLVQGNKPWDGGNLILNADEASSLLKEYPQLSSVIRPFMGSEELIKGKTRYCLWFKGISPSVYRNIPEINKRLKKVADVRSGAKSVKEQAETPMLFSQIRQPDSNYLAIPEVSSDKRKYIPIGFLEPNIIASNKLYLLPNASMLLFGIMISRVHMAWMRMVASTLGVSYSYSPAVYNNFPWPSPTDKQKIMIEKTAKAILDARSLYPDSTLADLYDPLCMPDELRQAHKANDIAVMKAYGFSPDIDEPKLQEKLMILYDSFRATSN